MKAVTLEFCCVQQHFVGDICAKFSITNLPQSPGIGQISNRGISDFRISGQSFINENYQNQFRTSHDIDMKLRPVIKLDKKNTATPKRFDDESYQQIVTSLSFF